LASVAHELNNPLAVIMITQVATYRIPKD
jgi:hypothetical protein